MIQPCNPDAPPDVTLAFKFEATSARICLWRDGYFIVVWNPYYMSTRDEAFEWSLFREEWADTTWVVPVIDAAFKQLTNQQEN